MQNKIYHIDNLCLLIDRRSRSSCSFASQRREIGDRHDPFITINAAGIFGLEWRFAWAALAGLHLLAGVAEAQWLIRSSPADEGQFPDGHASQEPFDAWREAASWPSRRVRRNFGTRQLIPVRRNRPPCFLFDIFPTIR